MLWLNYRHESRSRRFLKPYRADTHQIIEALTQKHDECLTGIFGKASAGRNYYTNNVQLVKSHEKDSRSQPDADCKQHTGSEHLCVVVESLAKIKGGKKCWSGNTAKTREELLLRKSRLTRTFPRAGQTFLPLFSLTRAQCEPARRVYHEHGHQSHERF